MRLCDASIENAHCWGVGGRRRRATEEVLCPLCLLGGRQIDEERGAGFGSSKLGEVVQKEQRCGQLLCGAAHQANGSTLEQQAARAHTEVSL